MFQVKDEIELSWAFYMIVVYFVKIKAFQCFFGDIWYQIW